MSKEHRVDYNNFVYIENDYQIDCMICKNIYKKPGNCKLGHGFNYKYPMGCANFNNSNMQHETKQKLINIYIAANLK